jgi:hypothetical protein
MAKSKKPTPLKDNVIVELTLKKPSKLILAGKENDYYKGFKPQKEVAYSVGPDNKQVKEGNEVIVDKMVRQDIHRKISFGTDDESLENKKDYVKIYYLAKGDEIFGQYE